MVTCFLNETEVRRYIADLANRLSFLNAPPTLICGLARSGTILFPYLINHPVADGVDLIGIDVQIEDHRHDVLLDEDAAACVRGKRVLLIDGAIHSGGTMAACVRHLLGLGALDVCSYALVIKRGTSFVPSMFGLMVNDTDRVYYLLDPLPNNRLQAGSRPPICGHLRKLEEADLSRPLLVSHVPSIDRVTWADRFYDSQTSGSRCTYLLEVADAVVGYLTISESRTAGMGIDEVVVDPSRQGHGYGGILLRFADTLARHAGHRTVNLMAIENKVGMYEGLGYRALRDKPQVRLPNDDGTAESYIPMERKILYHVRTEMDQ